jgi:hypothetical protein
MVRRVVHRLHEYLRDDERGDRALWREFRGILDRHQIEYTLADEEFTAHSVTSALGDDFRSRTFPVGTLVVSSG